MSDVLQMPDMNENFPEPNRDDDDGKGDKKER